MTECNIKDITDQCKRASGQVISINRMMEERRSCAEIIQQIIAARASLAKLAILLLEFEAKSCFQQPLNTEAQVKDLEKVITDLFKIT